MSRSRSRRNRWILEDNDWRAERDATPVPPPPEIIAQVPLSDLHMEQVRNAKLEVQLRRRWSPLALAAWVLGTAIVFGLAGYVIGILRA